jgi:G-protein signaling modulator 2
MVEQANGDAAMDEEESFFDLVTRFQSKRMDDQRCSLTVIDNKENQIMGSIHGNHQISFSDSLYIIVV